MFGTVFGDPEFSGFSPSWSGAMHEGVGGDVGTRMYQLMFTAFLIMSGYVSSRQ